MLIQTEEKAKNIRTLTGKVVSDKMNKTIVVLVEHRKKHLTGKYLKRFKKIHAHDENNSCKMGDVVLIKESRPLSKTKNWILEKVIESAI